jgi:hypothetical protein
MTRPTHRWTNSLDAKLREAVDTYGSSNWTLGTCIFFLFGFDSADLLDALFHMKSRLQFLANFRPINARYATDALSIQRLSEANFLQKKMSSS